MILSKERLQTEKKATSYRIEIIEKVIWLIEVLNAIAEDSYLSSRLVLKGGTALNLFHFDLPRLSVDADLNYIGKVERQDMLLERPEVEGRIQLLFERLGLTLIRNPRAHAGGKMIWRYQSALGNFGNIEVDLNFMYRIPLLPVEYKNSVMLAGRQVKNLQVLDLHELAAGKLTALLERQTGRDYFDANELFQCACISNEKLRLLFVIYAAMCSKKDLLKIDIASLNVDYIDLRNKLIPVMKENYYKGFNEHKNWEKDLLNSVRDGFNHLLPFAPKEKAFLEALRDGEGIKPDLLTTDEAMIEKIKSHPAIRWAGMKSKEQ